MLKNRRWERTRSDVASVTKKQKVTGDALLPHQEHGARGKALSRQRPGSPAALSHPARHIPRQAAEHQDLALLGPREDHLGPSPGASGLCPRGQRGAGQHKWRPN